ncbi:protein ACCELERATED CELL DEATH 6-like isoform X2 [Andrographis paniculata]|uniref:protein ACCELERATED CELL DEATH 6-like isoform X2 n=1 Tax=Andrographis paniculata TaxID=175694 RepID=UPI0021E9109C|nr:protein ACCELERATED CELL DEATH 6-like isoform X2 [Andrographis paniculata]
MPLLRAALRGDWPAAQRILEHDPTAALTWLDNNGILTAIEAAVGTGKDINFVKKLLEWIPDNCVAIKNDKGSTGLHIAASVGNREAAAVLVERMPALCYIPDKFGDFPVQNAAEYAHKNVLGYLLSITKGDAPESDGENPYAGMAGLRLLLHTIDAEFFDVGMYLVEKYPYLVGIKYPDGYSALVKLIGKSVFSNKRNFSFWERFISSHISSHHDIESIDHLHHTNKPQVLQSSHAMLWKLLEYLVPHIKTVKKKSLANEQALDLFKLMCTKLKTIGNFAESRYIYEEGVLHAAALGVKEAVEMIIDIFPLAIHAIRLPSRQSIFHEAVENRCEDVFNLIYQMSDHKYLFSNAIDVEENNLLHLAGKLAPAAKLNEISGAALQMQQELQWFKEVENFVHPSARESENVAGKTPQTVFSEEHKILKEQGERWMKDTANSCTIAAALIATVMFSGAITVPGGNLGSGFPIFSNDPVFIIFAIADAVSLFSSVTSLLMFLSILTSRYAEDDFLIILPKRLIYGLGSLFLSITSMMVAFSVTLYLVFGRKSDWVLVTVLAMALLPITSFVRLQFPLLVDLVRVTYGPGIFGKKSSRPFY